MVFKIGVSLMTLSFFLGVLYSLYMGEFLVMSVLFVSTYMGCSIILKR